MKLDLLAALNEECAARRAAILVTDIVSGQQRLVRETDVAAAPLSHRLQEHLTLRRSGKACARSHSFGERVSHHL
jgi:xanthine dehydrogenase accessory factor